MTIKEDHEANWEEAVRRTKADLLEIRNKQEAPPPKLPDFIVDGIPIIKLFREAGLCSSAGEARRLITQGGLYLNRQRITNHDQIINKDNAVNGKILLQRGKKTFYKIEV